MRNKSLIAAVTMSFGITACSTIPEPPTPSSVDLLESAVLVQPAVAQGAALFNQFSRGLTTQAAKQLNIGSILVEDFDGKPFSYINFTTKAHIGDAWTFATQFHNTAQPNGAGDSTIITGASTGRSIGLAMTDDLKLINALGRAVAQVGGRANVKRLVTLNGLWDVFLEDKAGNYWRVDQQPTVMSDSEVQEAKSQYRRVRERNNSLQLKTLLDAEWAKVLPESTQKTTNLNVSSIKTKASSDYSAFVDAEGNLDLAVVAQSIEQRGGVRVTSRGLSTQSMDTVKQDCWPFLWWSVCDPAWYGHLNRSNLPGGLLQAGAHYGTENYSVSGNNIMGCGPAAFISLAHWWNENADVNWYGKSKTGVTPYYKESFAGGVGNLIGDWWGGSTAYAPASFARIAGARQPSGLPLMTEYMGGFWFLNGTVVTPQGFIDGGRNWLNDQKAYYGVPSSLQLQGYYNASASVWGPLKFFGAVSASANAFNFSAAIRSETGYNDRPVIAVYPTGRSGGLEAHYSPVLRFHLIEGALATVWVTPEDTFVGSSNWEVNLGNVDNIVSGVFYFTN